MTRVTVWNEYRVEKSDEEAREVYPDGIHGVLADFLEDGVPELNPFHVRTRRVADKSFSLSEPEFVRGFIPPVVNIITELL